MADTVHVRASTQELIISFAHSNRYVTIKGWKVARRLAEEALK